MNESVIEQYQIATAGHRVRMPLAVIIDHLAVLAETPGAVDPRFRLQLDSAVRNAARLSAAVDDLLSAAVDDLLGAAGELETAEVRLPPAMDGAGNLRTLTDAELRLRLRDRLRRLGDSGSTLVDLVEFGVVNEERKLRGLPFR